MAANSAKILCIGGPLDGQHVTDCGMYLVVQLPDSHRNTFEPLIPQLRPCLELEEIKALTGSTCHREPKFLKEDHERRVLHQRRYEKRRWVSPRGGVYVVYIFEGMDDDDADDHVRKSLRA